MFCNPACSANQLGKENSCVPCKFSVGLSSYGKAVTLHWFMCRQRHVMPASFTLKAAVEKMLYSNFLAQHTFKHVLIPISSDVLAHVLWDGGRWGCGSKLARSASAAEGIGYQIVLLGGTVSSKGFLVSTWRVVLQCMSCAHYGHGCRLTVGSILGLKTFTFLAS